MSRRMDNEAPRLLQPLLERIHRQQHNGEQAERSRRFKQTLPYLILCTLGIFLMQFHHQIYNVIAGPFHLNREQLAKHLEIYNQNLSSSPLWRWFSLRKEYLQIEIGKDQLERRRSDVLRVFDDEHTRRTTLATIHIIKQPTIADGLSPDRFFIRLASKTQSYSRILLPYHFDAFTIRTLRCAVRHLGVARSNYNTWAEKSMFVRAIEKHYAENATHFNTMVAPACGMLMGYLYRPKGERAHLLRSTSVYEFQQLDIGFDASHAYYYYRMLVLIGVVVSCLLLRSFDSLMLYLSHELRPLQLVPCAELQAQLNELNVDSLQALDELLFATSERDHYQRRLFLIREQYFLVLDADLNEHNPQTLGLLYSRSPFSLYAVASIIQVVRNGFLIRNGHNETWVWLPSGTQVMSDSEAQWVHEHMMSLSGTYRR